MLPVDDGMDTGKLKFNEQKWSTSAVPQVSFYPRPSDYVVGELHLMKLVGVKEAGKYCTG